MHQPRQASGIRQTEGIKLPLDKNAQALCIGQRHTWPCIRPLLIRPLLKGEQPGRYINSQDFDMNGYFCDTPHGGHLIAEKSIVQQTPRMKPNPVRFFFARNTVNHQ